LGFSSKSFVDGGGNFCSIFIFQFSKRKGGWVGQTGQQQHHHQQLSKEEEEEEQ
jgi:hypothetical protein